MNAAPTNLTQAMTTLNNLRAELRSILIERNDEIDCALIAMLSRQHVLLLGPPGTAKSLLGELLAQGLQAKTFTRLLTKHTVPEELFGPYSLAGLENDRYERKTSGYLPEAEVAILDEIFKANSAILNALLTLLNERKFDNGTRREDCPLEFCLGMSNETPQDDSLGALYDRFVLRRWVEYISDEDHFRTMLLAPKQTVTTHLTGDEIAVLRAAVDAVKIPAEVITALIAIRNELAQKGIQPSDRRYRSAITLVRATAVLDGRDEASPDDLLVLKDCLWDNPDDAAEVTSVVISKASPDLNEAARLRDAAIEAYSELDMAKIEAGGAIKVRKQLAVIHQEMSKLKMTPKIEEYMSEVDSMGKEISRAVNAAMGL